MTLVPAPRPVAASVAALLLGVAALVGCSSGGSDDAGSTTTTAAASTTAAEPATSEPAETTSTSAAGGSGEVETVDLLEFLLDEDASIGDRFDWNTGAGVIAITYLGAQKVQLYTSTELDAEAAVAACELAGEHVFAIDEGAAIEVLTGTYPDGTVVASVDGADGTCAAP